ncbi:hypothetical protein VSH64_30360 [Amycolatopsis rhabdoformis]|uniref:Nuclear transport factor 2 family protein n=1 Tax=Amycolatopsis rhabdoformis TaxID=1448059 RepID=A0ABZ1HY91_9PSEU|nr:hypothetical protein [Amycolatopsis rhabdoformis]WSE27157.1 hypothetical protein VSH64_30360 [Amycolatopsis rhabdoformis]
MRLHSVNRKTVWRVALTVVLGLTLTAGTADAAVSSARSPAAHPPPVAVPPPGSVYASWTHSHGELVGLAPKARPSDVSSPQAIVSALHEALDGPQGKWNPDRLRSLVVPNAVFMALDLDATGATTVSNNSLVDFLQAVQDVHSQSGWYERVTKIIDVSTVAKKGGKLAVVHYTGVATTTPGGEPVAQGDSQASLMFDGARWWVVSDTW